MKKYTQPSVEITAFDFEDITMSTIGGNSINADNASTQQNFRNDVMQDSANTVTIPW